VKLANAVFKGGGVKGIALTGALCAVEAEGWRWKGVAGTSAGAITAALVAAGYEGYDVHQIINGLDFNLFKDKESGLKFINVWRHEGVYKGQYVIDLMNRLLSEKLGKAEVTFADLPIPLRVVATDLTNKRMLTFPDDLAGAPYGLVNPHLFPVAEAVRASMSIPLFFEPYQLRLPNGTTATLVDGGLLSNFPIHLFAPQGTKEDVPTFGFCLESPHDAEPHPTDTLEHFLAALVDTVLSGRDNSDQHNQTYERSIMIPTGIYQTTQFDIDQAGKDWLYLSGRKAGAEFLATVDVQQWISGYSWVGAKTFD